MQSWRASALVFGTSAAVLMIEIVAGRLMAPYVGVSLETFTGIIGTVLAGIAIGSAVGGHLADRHDPRRLVAGSLLLAGGFTWLSLPALAILGPVVTPGPLGIIVLTSASFLVPATVLSAIGPMVTKLRLESLSDTGSVVGGLSAAGTAGALAGTFVTGFVLVATLRSSVVVMVVGGVLIASGVAVTWRWARRGPGLAVATVLAAIGFGMVTLPATCDMETPYFCVQIERDADRPSGRDLYLDRARHAHVDLDDPTYLELRYVRLLGAVSSQMPEGPLDVVHLGGGGFTLPRYLAHQRPGSEQVVLEIDPDLPNIARDHLGLSDDPSIDIRIGDARLALDELPTDGVDLVIGDAFAGTSVPWHLTTTEVMLELDRVLRPGGIYAMNVIDGGDNGYARAQAATLAQQFEHLQVIVPADGVGDRRVNQILVASDRPLPQLRIDAVDGAVLDTGREVSDFIDGAAPLRDDHAPVDQLMLR